MYTVFQQPDCVELVSYRKSDCYGSWETIDVALKNLVAPVASFLVTQRPATRSSIADARPAPPLLETPQPGQKEMMLFC